MDYYVFDLDGPNYPFITNLAKVASEVLERPLEQFSTIQDEWSGFMDDWGISLEEFRVLYALGVRNGDLLWEGDPTPGAVQGWSDIACRQDAYIHVVTDRNPFGAIHEAHEATHYWLATHGLYFDEISFTGNKPAIVKESIERLGVDAANVLTIDDNMFHCKNFKRAGFHSVVFSQPSNSGIMSDLPRVSSMVEFAQIRSLALR